MEDEIFPVVEPDGRVVGRATRRECHGGSMLLHPVVHLHVVGPGGTLYLQKRSIDKDIQPGRWDTAVGGHVDYGEAVDEALCREAREELGLDLRALGPQRLTALPPYVFQSDRERELVNTFVVSVDEGVAITPDPGEISEGRFWPLEAIEAAVGQGILTPNFEREFLSIKPLLLRLTTHAQQYE